MTKKSIFLAAVLQALSATTLQAQDSLNVTRVGYLNLPSESFDIAVSGGYAYIADGQMGLYVIDISDPSNPIEVGHTIHPTLLIVLPYQVGTLSSLTGMADFV